MKKIVLIILCLCLTNIIFSFFHTFGKSFNQRIFTYDIEEDSIIVKVPVFDFDTNGFNGCFLNRADESFAEHDIFSEHVIFTSSQKSATIYDSATLYYFSSFYPKPNVESYIGIIKENERHGIVYLYDISLSILDELGINPTGEFTEIKFYKNRIYGGPYPDANGYYLIFAISPTKKILLVDLFYEKLPVFSFDFNQKNNPRYETLAPIYKRQRELFNWMKDLLPEYK